MSRRTDKSETPPNAQVSKSYKVLNLSDKARNELLGKITEQIKKVAELQPGSQTFSSNGRTAATPSKHTQKTASSRKSTTSNRSTINHRPATSGSTSTGPSKSAAAANGSLSKKSTNKELSRKKPVSKRPAGSRLAGKDLLSKDLPNSESPSREFPLSTCKYPKSSKAKVMGKNLEGQPMLLCCSNLTPEQLKELRAQVEEKGAADVELDVSDDELNVLNNDGGVLKPSRQKAIRRVSTGRRSEPQQESPVDSEDEASVEDDSDDEQDEQDEPEEQDEQDDDVQAECEPELESDQEQEPETESETESQVESEIQSEVDSEVDSEVESEVESEVGSEADLESQQECGLRCKFILPPKLTGISAGKQVAKSAARQVKKSKERPKSRPVAKPTAKPTTKPTTKPTAKPVAGAFKKQSPRSKPRAPKVYERDELLDAEESLCCQCHCCCSRCNCSSAEPRSPTSSAEEEPEEESPMKRTSKKRSARREPAIVCGSRVPRQPAVKESPRNSPIDSKKGSKTRYARKFTLQPPSEKADPGTRPRSGSKGTLPGDGTGASCCSVGRRPRAGSRTGRGVRCEPEPEYFGSGHDCPCPERGYYENAEEELGNVSDEQDYIEEEESGYSESESEDVVIVFRGPARPGNTEGPELGRMTVQSVDGKAEVTPEVIDKVIREQAGDLIVDSNGNRFRTRGSEHSKMRKYLMDVMNKNPGRKCSVSFNAGSPQ